MNTHNTLKDYLPFGKPNFSAEEIRAVTRVMQTGWIGMGPETIAFEEELAQYLGASHVVTTNSCTSALFLSLLVCGVGPGDEVICPSLTWCATANAVVYLGARPVFCDVSIDSMCATAETIAAKVTPKTKAVIVVHYGGLPADIDAIRAILPPTVTIVEDAAHAFGAKYPDGTPVGSSGNLTCFSFYANKNLSTGEGGAIVVDNRDWARRLRSLRHQGLSADAWNRFRDPRAALTPIFEEIGYKMNYTDLQASIGRVQLRRQPEFEAIRLAIARYYVRTVQAAIPRIGFQSQLLDSVHARHLVAVTLPLETMKQSRNDIVFELRNRKIGASIHYRPLHTIALYAERSPASLANTDWIAERVMTLPISASMTTDDARTVVTDLLDVIGRGDTHEP